MARVTAVNENLMTAPLAQGLDRRRPSGAKPMIRGGFVPLVGPLRKPLAGVARVRHVIDELAPVVTGLRAVDVLLEAGLLQDMAAAMCRMLDKIGEDVAVWRGDPS